MPIQLSRGDRKLFLIAGGAFLLMVGASFLLARGTDSNIEDSSTYGTGSSGTKAAYLLLKAAGYPVERWERPPKDLPADAHGILLIVASPVTYPRNEESDAFARFLLHGGTILVAGLLPDAFVTQADRVLASADDDNHDGYLGWGTFRYSVNLVVIVGDDS